MANFGDVRRRRCDRVDKTPLARVIYDEDYLKVLFDFINGTPLSRAVRNHEIDWLAFRRFAQSTPERANAYAEAERLYAWKLMEGALLTAEQLLKRNKDVQSFVAYYRVVRDTAKAFDNSKWGEKVEVAARALIINTNVGGEVGADEAGTVETAGGTFRMSIEAPEPAQQVLLGECERVSDVADVQQVLQKSNIEVDPGVD